MSFPKAKLLRFNEEMTCAPPPGKYDPNFDSKVKGAVIEKSKRFVEPKIEHAVSIESLDSASTCSHYQFRTPQLPKKKVVTTPRSAIEHGRSVYRTPTGGTTPASKSKKKLDDVFRFETEKNLVEQINELTRVHTSQLIEKDEELNSLQREITDLKNSYNNIEDSHEKDMKNLRIEHDNEIVKLKKELENAYEDMKKDKVKHDDIVKELNCQTNVLEENVKNSNSLNNELEYRLAEHQLSLIEMNNKYFTLQEELKEAKAKMETLIVEHKTEIKTIQDRHSEELVDIAAEMDIKKMEYQVEFTCKVEQISEEVKMKVKTFDEQATTIFENVKLMAEEFDTKFNDLIESLQTCTEINENKLSDYIYLSEEMESQKAENLEQKIIIVDLQDRIDVLNEDLEKFKKQCKKYEIVQTEANKTIRVLSIRLYESESEVERLNDNEEELTLRKDALEEKVRALLNENKELKANITEMEVNLVGQVKEVEAHLVGKVDSYRRLVVEEKQKYKTALNEKQRTIDMMVGDIDYYRKKATESAEFNTLYQNRISNYKDELSELKSTIESFNRDKTTLEKDLKDKVETVKNLQEKLEECKNTLAKAEEHISVMKESGFEQERHIEELASKLNQNFLNYSKQINDLTREIEGKYEDIKVLKQDIGDKDLKVASLSAELLESKNYVQSMTEHVVSLMNELTEKNRQCENLNHEIEIKNATMIQVSEEYEEMKEKLKLSQKAEKDFQESQRDNDKYKYVDEFISELVLEKGRCSELEQGLEEYNTKIDEKKIDPAGKVENVILNDKGVLEIKLYEVNEPRIEQDNNQLMEENKLFVEEFNEYELEEEHVQLKEVNYEKVELVDIIKRQCEEMELLTNEVESQQDQIEELKQHGQDNINEIFALQQSLNDTQKVVIQLKSREEDLVYKLKSAEAELNETEAENEDHVKMIKELSEKNSELSLQLETMEKKKNYYKCYLVELQEEINKLKTSNSILKEEYDKVQQNKCVCERDPTKYASIQSRIAELENRNKELENIIEPFREQLLQFERERAALLSKTENTEKELKAVTLEHAKALGHQNHKQKIKHVVHLTETICELKKEMEKLRTENSKLRQTIIDQQHKDGSLRKTGLIRTTARKVDKENNTTKPEATSPLGKNKNEQRQASPASSALKQRNGLNMWVQIS